MNTTIHRLCAAMLFVFLFAGNHVLAVEHNMPEPKNGRLQLSLNHCVQLALDQNLDVQLAVERLAEADTKIRQARAAMLPILSAEGTYTRLDEELAFAMGPQSLTFMESDIYMAGLVVRQPLFAGGRINAGRKAAKYSREAYASEKRSVEDETVFQVTRAYWAAQIAASAQHVAAEAVALLYAHERDVSSLVEQGEVAELDLLRTRTERANAQKQLNVAGNAAELAQSALKNLLAIDLDQLLMLTDHLEMPSRRPGTDLCTLTQQALAQRDELHTLDFLIAATGQSLKAAKGEYAPSIAIEGRYGYIQGDVRDLEGGEHWTIGVGAELPIWNWGRIRAKVGQANSQLAQVRTLRRKTADGIRLEVHKALLDIETAAKNIEAAEMALGSAKEAYRQARVGYQAGEGTNTDVLDARTALSRAEMNHSRALFAYNVALAALRRATGTDAGEMKNFGKELDE